MDAVFFPYNSMFAIDFTKKYTASAYSVKVNGAIVPITQHLYWKKDFLEETLINYCRYKKNHDVLFMDNYLDQRVLDKEKKEFLSSRLTPDKSGLDQWPFWYIHFAGYTIPPGATVELFQYDLIFENNAVTIKDSASIYKTSFL
ncbi:MAG: hypothetical protein QM737_21440 [Ferruginibacter sp.]